MCHEHAVHDTTNICAGHWREGGQDVSVGQVMHRSCSLTVEVATSVCAEHWRDGGHRGLGAG